MLPEEELKSHLDPTSKRAQIVKAMKMSKEKKKEKKEEKKEEKDEKKKKAKEKKEGKALDKIVKQIKPVEVRNPFRRLNEKQKKKKIQDLVDQTETGKQLANLTDILQQPNEGMRNMVVGITDASADPGDQVDPFGGEPYSGSDLVGTESIGYDMLRGYGGGMITGLGKKTTGPGVGNVNLDRKIQPKVTGGLAQVSGRLDRETVRKVIRRKLSGIRRCYQDSLQRDKGLKGRLTLAFRITPNGTVTGITVTGMESDVALTACVKRRIAVWRFPAPKSSGVIKVKYPVFLKTQSSQ
jgi:outer membrane biosynthesis protein TonB